HAGAPRRWIGLRPHDVDRCAGAVGDPLLVAVDDPVVAVLPSGGREARDVGAGRRLAERHRGDLDVALVVGAFERAQEFWLLLLGAHARDRARREPAAAEREADAGAAPRELLAADARDARGARGLLGVLLFFLTGERLAAVDDGGLREPEA